jgi:hypothetical protein
VLLLLLLLLTLIVMKRTWIQDARAVGFRFVTEEVKKNDAIGYAG